tara:strand:+ start:90 stop:1010 length:921 start_codon:yes stop_codon:yes gene_type:complete
MTIEQEFLNAARTGDQETFIRILNDQSIKIDPNHADEEGNTALMLAAREGHAAIVDMLLTGSSVGPGHANQFGYMALIIAAREGHSEIVSALLADQRVDPNHLDGYGYTALIWAARNGHSDIVRALLTDPRVDPNHTDEDDDTTLILAAWGGHAAIVSTLLADKRIDPNHADKYGRTALIQAAFHGHSDIVSALIDDPRIDLSLADQAKKAIIAATKSKHNKTQRLLLKSSGQRLSVDEIANLTDRDRDFYNRILTRLLWRERFRGIVRLMIYFRRIRLRTAQAIYAPGGTGYAVAADSFATAASQ